MFHFIFDYNYGNFWSILIVLYRWKQEWILSLQLNYVSTLPGKTKNNTKTAARLLQLLVSFFSDTVYNEHCNAILLYCNSVYCPEKEAVVFQYNIWHL